MLKRWLDDHKVEYQNYMVDENPYAAQMMVDVSGQMGVPFTTIEKDDGEQINILGFDRPMFEEALKKR
jgi:glutaredoxin